MKKRIDTYSRLGSKRDEKYLVEEKEKFIKNAKYEIPRIIQVHEAWLIMLVKTGIFQKNEAVPILNELEKIKKEGLKELIDTYDLNFPKIYLQLERYLTDKLGYMASNVNIGRTVPPPLYRMEVREALVNAIECVLTHLKVLLVKSAEHIDTVMPGYTHMQHAQPQTYGHYLLGYYDAISRGYQQLIQAFKSTNMIDMGGGAMAGISYNIDRYMLADLLGFDGIIEHSNDCMAATDFNIDILAALSNISLPLCRVANELDVWSTQEFNYVEISDHLAHTSSMMPQKKNPCVFEDARAFLGRIAGAFTDICIRAHNTQYGDVVEIMKLAQSTVPVIHDFCKIMNDFTEAIDTLIIKKENMKKGVEGGFSTCTELAHLIFNETRMPLRLIHSIIGSSVKEIYESCGTYNDINLKLLNKHAKNITGFEINISDESIKESLDPDVFIQRQISTGGTSPKEVRRMISERETHLTDNDEKVLINFRNRLNHINQLLENEITLLK